jgi:hypothetical protein
MKGVHNTVNLIQHCAIFCYKYGPLEAVTVIAIGVINVQLLCRYCLHTYQDQGKQHALTIDANCSHLVLLRRVEINLGQKRIDVLSHP